MFEIRDHAWEPASKIHAQILKGLFLKVNANFCFALGQEPIGFCLDGINLCATLSKPLLMFFSILIEYLIFFEFPKFDFVTPWTRIKGTLKLWFNCEVLRVNRVFCIVGSQNKHILILHDWSTSVFCLSWSLWRKTKLTTLYPYSESGLCCVTNCTHPYPSYMFCGSVMSSSISIYWHFENL